MGLRFDAARAIGAVSTWGLRHVFRRPAANFPGKIGLYADPQLIGDLASRIREGSVVVVGTNGKTTVTNLLADAFELAGKSVVCNRTGANLDSGVSTALLHTHGADWGIFESDELWLAKILPQLKSDYVVLLNLFRDQLDRVGEIDHIQESIAGALAESPNTTLIYNSDDPFCQAVANRVNNPCIAFGIAEDLGLAQNTVADSGMCQQCDDMLNYEWREYGQLGNYHCPTCGFARTEPAYAARNIRISHEGTTCELCMDNKTLQASNVFTGAYMVYNVLALHAAADLCDIDAKAVEEAIRSFDPKNGRLQAYELQGRCVLLNLAKNPTGFNQNLNIVLQDEGPTAVAFFINDKEADGHDVSWLWDIDFQQLAGVDGLAAFAGGIRRNDMQVRLKYAGMDASLVDGARDFLEKAWTCSPDANCYIIANYTALPEVKAELDKLSQGEVELHIKSEPSSSESTPETISDATTTGRTLTIMHLYPTLLNLYGDGGNVTVLAERARKRGIDIEVVRVDSGQSADFEAADIVFLGGGPDREQHKASQELLAQADALHAYVEDDGVLLAICGGYQIIGTTWLMGDEAVPGLGLIDIVTKRAEGGSHNRLVDNIALESPLATMPVVGYENHAGRTYLGEGCKPFGHVLGQHGHGNNDDDHADGVVYRNVIGTYLHGPLLAKNPEIADWLISRALSRRASKQSMPTPSLPQLEDTAEIAANAFMLHRLHI